MVRGPSGEEEGALADGARTVGYPELLLGLVDSDERYVRRPLVLGVRGDRGVDLLLYVVFNLGTIFGHF